jgi:hypothetical protein
MRRRDLVKGIVGSAATWPVVAVAQQSAIPVIGFLSFRSANESADSEAGFRQGLSEIGYSEGRSVYIAFRWAEGQKDRLPPFTFLLSPRKTTRAQSRHERALSGQQYTRSRQAFRLRRTRACAPAPRTASRPPAEALDCAAAPRGTRSRRPLRAFLRPMGTRRMCVWLASPSDWLSARRTARRRSDAASRGSGLASSSWRTPPSGSTGIRKWRSAHHPCNFLRRSVQKQAPRKERQSSLRSSSGGFAILAAIRHASSCVSNFATERSSGGLELS